MTFNPWIFFGTGRYILETDPADKTVQSWYGIEDDGTAISGRSVLKARQIKLAGTIDGNPCARSNHPLPVTWPARRMAGSST